MSSTRKRILLGHLASNGDCLYATAIARQIKLDYPNCHLTWAIASKYQAIIEGNPDVDEVWEIPYYTVAGHQEQWDRFESEARERQTSGDFDEIFLTQISLRTYSLWVGSVRASIFRHYPRPITVDITPVLRLSAPEVGRVRDFAAQHRLSESRVVLFECAPRSLQSLLTPQFARDVARALVEKYPDTAIVLTSDTPFESDHPNIIDGSVLTLRENAELTKYCSLLVGASSGVTWIATSDWAKPLPMIQLVIPDVARSNSVCYEFQRCGQDISQVIEMNDYSLQDVVSCVGEVWDSDFAVARKKFHQNTPFKFHHYKRVQFFFFVKLRWQDASQFLRLNIETYGLKPQFILILIFLFFKCLFLLPFVTFLKTIRVLPRHS